MAEVKEVTDIISEVGTLNVEACKNKALAAAQLFKHPGLRTQLEEEIKAYAGEMATVGDGEKKDKMLESFDDYGDVLRGMSVLANKDYDRQQKAMLKNFDDKKV